MVRECMNVCTCLYYAWMTRIIRPRKCTSHNSSNAETGGRETEYASKEKEEDLQDEWRRSLCLCISTVCCCVDSICLCMCVWDICSARPGDRRTANVSNDSERELLLRSAKCVCMDLNDCKIIQKYKNSLNSF